MNLSKSERLKACRKSSALCQFLVSLINVEEQQYEEDCTLFDALYNMMVHLTQKSTLDASPDDYEISFALGDD